MTTPPDDITCMELVELVTDYLEGALPPADLDRLEAHLESCEDCRTYVDQVRATVAASGRVDEQALDEGVREALLQAFRGWKREGGL